MKYIGSLMACMITLVTFGSYTNSFNLCNHDQYAERRQRSEQLCKEASKLLTWSPAPYTKVTAEGKKYLYYMQKPDKHVFLVADHGVISFPLDAGKYRYFENIIYDRPLRSPMFVQREIDFDRWNKLKDCKCDLNCPCWQGLDCTCDCCKANVDVGKAARQNPSE